MDTFGFDGTFDVDDGDVITLQVMTTHTDLELAGSNVFNNPVSASINFEEISHD